MIGGIAEIKSSELCADDAAALDTTPSISISNTLALNPLEDDHNGFYPVACAKESEPTQQQISDVQDEQQISDVRDGQVLWLPKGTTVM